MLFILIAATVRNIRVPKTSRFPNLRPNRAFGGFTTFFKCSGLVRGSLQQVVKLPRIGRERESFVTERASSFYFDRESEFFETERASFFYFDRESEIFCDCDPLSERKAFHQAYMAKREIVQERHC